MLNQIFSTPVLRNKTSLSEADLAEIARYFSSIRKKTSGEKKSNRGGWHSEGNLFAPEHPIAPTLTEVVKTAIFTYIAQAFAYNGEIELSITGWTVINRQGDYNVPHNHAANLVSGALYIAVPEGMRGGEIVFQDPRLNLNAHETPGMRKSGVQPPWMVSNISVAPTSGEILIFPSWLIHWVEPFQCEKPDAERIVVSFNATVN